MLMLTTDTPPAFLEVVEVMGMTEITFPIPLSKGIVEVFFQARKNEHDEALTALKNSALSYRGSKGTAPNLVYGIKATTSTMQGANGPVLLMTYIGTVAVCRHVEDTA